MKLIFGRNGNFSDTFCLHFSDRRKMKKLISSCSTSAIIFFILVSFNHNKRAREQVAAWQSNWERAKVYNREYLNASTEEVIHFKPASEMRILVSKCLFIWGQLTATHQIKQVR